MDLVQDYEELPPRGLAVDRTLLTTTWLMVAVFFCVVTWELIKWYALATSRRARRLARLRDQTADVVQRELQNYRMRRDHSESEPTQEPQAANVQSNLSRTRGAPSRRAMRGSGPSVDFYTCVRLSQHIMLGINFRPWFNQTVFAHDT